jgi:hypothetical protein
MHDPIPLPASGALATELADDLDSAADYAAASLSESTRRPMPRTPYVGAAGATGAPSAQCLALSGHAAAPAAAQGRRIALASFWAAASIAEHGTRQSRLDRKHPALHHGENSYAVRLGRPAVCRGGRTPAQ